MKNPMTLPKIENAKGFENRDGSQFITSRLPNQQRSKVLPSPTAEASEPGRGCRIGTATRKGMRFQLTTGNHEAD